MRRRQHLEKNFRRYLGTRITARIAAIWNILSAALLGCTGAETPQLGSQPSFAPLCPILVMLCHH
jgi:hypothetical protein